MLGNADDDRALTDTDIEYGDSNDDEEEAETSFVNMEMMKISK